LRLKARSWRVKEAAFSPAFLISSISLRKDSSLMTSINASSAFPMMVVSILLKSWAIPPASVPMASIFWDCRSCSSILLRLVISCPIARMPVMLPFLSFNVRSNHSIVASFPSLVTIGFIFPLVFISEMALVNSSPVFCRSHSGRNVSNQSFPRTSSMLYPDSSSI